jgi:hypothetical protein
VNLGCIGKHFRAFDHQHHRLGFFGNFIDYKDLQGNGPVTTSGLIINNGTVTATSVLIQNTTSGANMKHERRFADNWKFFLIRRI